MFRRGHAAAVVVLALASGATAVLPAAGTTNEVVVTHKLIVAVTKNLPAGAERKLAVLVVIRENSGAPAGAVATPGKPLTVLLDNPGFYRLRAEVASACRGHCAASYRISGSANHRVEIVPSCRPTHSGFVCSTVEIAKVY